MAVPDQEAVKQAILARRKQDLLAKLASGEATAPSNREEQLESVGRLPPSW